MKEKTITEVMREPIVSYAVHADLGDEEINEPYHDEASAIDAARMLFGGGAARITVERQITRIVNEFEDVEWREGSR